MFTDALPKGAAHPADVDTAVRRVVRRARRWAQETACGLHGHDYLLQTGNHRVFLRCATCGHETPGWREGTLRRAGGRGVPPTSEQRGSWRCSLGTQHAHRIDPHRAKRRLK